MNFKKMKKITLIFTALIITCMLVSENTSAQLEHITGTGAKNKKSVSSSSLSINPQNLSQSQMQKMIQQYKNGQTKNILPKNISTTAKKQSVSKNKIPEKNGSADYEVEYSNIEHMYNSRYLELSDKPLTQYGYNFFNNESREKYLPLDSGYKVGPGDGIAVYFWGDPVDILGLNGFYTINVDRNGKIFIPSLGVFYVWGLEINKVKTILHKALSAKFRRFEIEVTLGQLREFPVYISGYVKKPGIVMASGMNNILDVIALAGGIEKNGSLRKISIRRLENSKISNLTIDMYKFLVKGEPVNIRIKEGDSVFVSPLGKTASVGGSVNRPAIYELKSNGDTSVQELISLSGGIMASAHTTGVKIVRFENNSLKISEGKLSDPAFKNKKLNNGDLIILQTLYNLVQNEIRVKGHIAYPGSYSFKPGMKLGQIIKKIGILPDTNLFSAAVMRESAGSGINFSPADILSGKKDINLNEKDTIIFYPKWMYRPVQVMGDVLTPSIIPYYDGITLLDVLRNMKYKKAARYMKAEIFWEKNHSFNILPENQKKNINKEMFTPFPIKTLKRDNEAPIKQEDSKNPEKTPDYNFISVYLNDLLIKASEKANIKLPPGARVFIRSTEDNEKRESITILGEVDKPGVYVFNNGDTLYDYLKNAGGYTGNAYPKGLILIRRSVQRLQEEQIKISFLSMQEHLSKQTDIMAMAGSSPEERAILQLTISKYQQMMNILNKKSKMSLGRVALEVPMKLENLKEDPENIKLMDGDYVYIPAKPNYVLVLGDVYNQVSLPYNSGRTVKYYINQLGGMRKNADKDNIYIIKSNGKIVSKTQYSSFFNLYFSIDWSRKRINLMKDFETLRLDQGDTIVIPSELKVPIMWRPILKDITQIMFQTISTAVLATSL